MKTVLIAPDSFKGSLTSVQVARALADGWLRARPDDEILLCPLADGGEGTLAAIEAAGGWTWRTGRVHDPLGRPIEARWLLSDDGATRRRRDGRSVGPVAAHRRGARIRSARRPSVPASSIGAAIDAGARHVTLGIGGSATTDGGRGLLEGARCRRWPSARPTSTRGGLRRRRTRSSVPRRGRDLWPAEGRDPGRGRDARRAQRRLGGRARGAEGGTSATPRVRARPVASVSRCWPSRTGSRSSPCARASSS